MKQKNNRVSSRPAGLERYHWQMLCEQLPLDRLEDRQAEQVLAFISEAWLNMRPVRSSRSAQIARIEARHDCGLDGCERCRRNVLMDVIQVVSMMILDPHFARFLGQLAQRNLHSGKKLGSLNLATVGPASLPTSTSFEPLTDREMEVLQLLAKRCSNQDIAHALFISPLTVKTHVHRIFQKLGVSRRRFAIQRARELGLVQVD